MYKVNIVIPSVNGIEYLKKLLPTLKMALIENSIITVVECGYSDSVFEDQNPKVDILYRKGVHSFASNCNIGARSKESKYILFLNNDTTVDKNLISEMVQTMESNKLNSIVGAKIYDLNGEQIQHAGVGFTDEGYAHEICEDINVETEYNAVTGACMLIDKEYFDKVGGFDENFRNGWEDNDLCLKVRELNRRVVYCPRAIVYHKKHSTEGRFQNEAENRLLFGRIWVDTKRIKKII